MAKAPPKAIGSQKHGAWQALFRRAFDATAYRALSSEFSGGAWLSAARG